MVEKFTFFWKGPLSQWKKSRFEVDHILYTRAEQYMMAEKARLFGDNETLIKIMQTDNPKEQKDLGREVKGFVKEEWDAVARDKVYAGNYAKFTQNPELKEKLLKTASTTLVEASPEDGIWGIKLAADDPKAQNRDTWQGLNWLGETLTKLRDDLLEEQ